VRADSRIRWGMVAVLAILGTTGAGCGGKDAEGRHAKSLGAGAKVPTVGQAAKVLYAQSLVLEGYGLVGGLPGTGSSECPAGVKDYLRRYAQSQVSANHSVDVDKLLGSGQTAVVYLEATLGPVPLRGDLFDVKVTAVSHDQAVSLEGGWLYTADLNPKGLAARPIRSYASAEGPVYIDQVASTPGDWRGGYILGGGRLADQPQITILTDKEDFRTTSAIRNLINDRFGSDTARALSPTQIGLRMPPQYRLRRAQFVSMVEAIPLDQSQQPIQESATRLVSELATTGDRSSREIALEAIGPASLGQLGALLQSSDEAVRLSGARCMANLGSPRGIETLAAIARTPGSPRRQEAISAIVDVASLQRSSPILQDLLEDDNVDVVVAACEGLLKIDPSLVPAVAMTGRGSIGQVVEARRKVILAERSGRPRITVFGQPTWKAGQVFSWRGGRVVLDSGSGGYPLATARYPGRNTIGPLQGPPRVYDLIQFLCAERAAGQPGRGGLGLPYSDVLSLLKQACDGGFIDAQFSAGPLASPRQTQTAR
jgi:hypothetical protein